VKIKIVLLSVALGCSVGLLADAGIETTGQKITQILLSFGAGEAAARSIVTKQSRPAEWVVAFYNHRGTAEQHINWARPLNEQTNESQKLRGFPVVRPAKKGTGVQLTAAFGGSCIFDEVVLD
jgi:hypothetical protein